jgi:hypothetical protein
MQMEININVVSRLIIDDSKSYQIYLLQTGCNGVDWIALILRIGTNNGTM